MNSKKILFIFISLSILLATNLFTNKIYAAECQKINENEVKYFNSKITLTNDNGEKTYKNVQFPIYNEGGNTYSFESAKYHLKYNNKKLELHQTNENRFYTEDENCEKYEDNYSTEYEIEIPFVLATDNNRCLKDQSWVNEILDFYSNTDFNIYVDGQNLNLKNPSGEINTYMIDLKNNILYTNGDEQRLLDNPLDKEKLHKLILKISEKKGMKYVLRFKFNFWLTGVCENYYDIKTNKLIDTKAQNGEEGDEVKPNYKTFKNYQFNNCDAKLNEDGKIIVNEGINYVTHYYDKLWDGEIDYLDYENNKIISEPIYFKSKIEEDLLENNKNIESYSFYEEKREYDDNNNYLKLICYYKSNEYDKDKNEKTKELENDAPKDNKEDSVNKETKEYDEKNITNDELNNKNKKTAESKEKNNNDKQTNESQIDNKDNLNKNSNKKTIEKDELKENKIVETINNKSLLDTNSKINNRIEKINNFSKAQYIKLPKAEITEEQAIKNVETPKTKKAYSYENLMIGPKKISENNKIFENDTKSKNRVSKNKIINDANTANTANEITEKENQIKENIKNSNKIEDTYQTPLPQTISLLEGKIKSLKFKLKIWIIVAFINLFVTILLILNKLKKK